MVKAFWFRIVYRGCDGRPPRPARRAGKSYAGTTRTETVLYTGTDLASVVRGIERSQRERLARDPGAFRILRITAVYCPPLDAAFKLFVDETLRLENNERAASL